MGKRGKCRKFFLRKKSVAFCAKKLQSASEYQQFVCDWEALIVINDVRTIKQSVHQGMVWNGKWNKTEILLWNKEYARMEWKTIFHTFIPIPY